MTLLLPYEVWRDIKGYEGKYQVSARGRVKSVFRLVSKIDRWGNLARQIIPEKIKSTFISKHGYARVPLWNQGKSKNHMVHRIVALAFLPNFENRPHVNHIDGIRVNNDCGNLEWVTESENMIHSYRQLHRKHPMRGRKYKDNPKSIPIIQMDIAGNAIRLYRNAEEAHKIGGFHTGCISMCCNGKSKTHRGYRWMHA